MKKLTKNELKPAIILTFTLALALMLTLTACATPEPGYPGGDPTFHTPPAEVQTAKSTPTDISPPDDTDTAVERPFAFTYGGVSITVGSILPTELGEPVSRFESESCAFGELDQIITYSGFELNTYRVDGIDYILFAAFNDDSITTDEGIYIGSDRRDVLDVYGTPTTDAANSLTYSVAGMTLTFIFEDDIVADITYYDDEVLN
jgi:hypothetical protein